MMPHCQGRPGLRRCTGVPIRYLLEAPRRLGLCVLLTMLGAFTIAGCYLERTVEQATASDVNDRSFAFPDGAVFHPDLVNVAVTLSFTNNAAAFTLSSSGEMATGTNRFDSCILTVATSTYDAGAGPQEGDVITLDPCDFDSDTLRLTVENRNIVATSDRATPIGTGDGGGSNQATASDVNNQRFTFSSGAVFHSALANISTALEFSDDEANSVANDATIFELSSSRGTAMGTNRFSSCILTVETSTYDAGAGPQEGDVIALNPCTFNRNDRTLTVTRGATMETSAPAVVR